MFSPLRNRFGIPGVISVIALVFAMFGGAYAATDSGDGDKATASAKAKKGPRGPRGKTGKTGPAGPAGPQGPAGAKGDTGAAGSNGTNGTNGTDGVDGTDGTSVTSEEFGSVGKDEKCVGTGGTKFTAGATKTYACNGEEGEEGSPWTLGGTLPSEATETGTWFFQATEAELQLVPLGFSIPLSAADAAAITVHYWIQGEPANQDAKCKGTPNDPKADPGTICLYAGSGGKKVSIPPLVKPDLESPGIGTSGAFFRAEFFPPESVGGSFAVTAP